MLQELSRNQPILRFDVILQHDWPIEQCLPHIGVFFGGKAKRPCFDLFTHWLIKQITNTYRKHFSRDTKIALSAVGCTIRSVGLHSLNLAFLFFFLAFHRKRQFFNFKPLSLNSSWMISPGSCNTHCLHLRHREGAF